MKILAIILARGGSKRIPRKNIKDFYGKPIIAYSIDAAIKSECFDTIMCSTDDKEIAEIATSYGASVPFFRSEANSNDYATMADVLTEVINEFENRNLFFDYFCCIYPTAPFIDSEKLKNGLYEMQKNNASAAMPVVAFSYPIQRALKITNGKISMLEEKYLKTRSQDLMKTYHDAGQYYWFETKAFKKEPNIMMLNPIAIVTPEMEVHDIDSLEDWEVAELKYSILHKDH